MAPAKTAMDEMSAKGEFKRTDAQFRNWVKADGSTEFAPEKDRYHLIISLACPWASRCLAVLRLKGLDEVIGLTVVDPVFVKTSEDPEDKHRGWAFNKDARFKDFKTVRDLYEAVSKDTSKFTVPILYDLSKDTIVSNESSEIIRMLGQEFNEFATKNKEVDYYPESQRAEIEAVNEWIYPKINNGVYRSGFAQSQEAYDAAVKDVFDGLDEAEAILAQQRYIASTDRITEADIRLFVTLVRFDEVYHGHFKCNKARVSDYPNLHNYTRELYQIPEIKSSVDMHHIKQHYHRSHPTINPFGIVPAGPDTLAELSKPHDRDRAFS